MTTIPKVLLVTNDFPPTVGGIQSYLSNYVDELPPDKVVVFASTQDEVAARAFDERLPYKVVRWQKKVMLPSSGVAKAMTKLIQEEDIDTVWFGASAPLGILGKQAKEAGAHKVIVSTHGHEVGWSMFFPTRAVLRRIGKFADVITFVSDYARRRMQASFSTTAPWIALPSGVDSSYFQPDPARAKELKNSLGLNDKKIIVCISRLVPRKGQDTLIEAMPEILERHPHAHLLIVGRGEYRKKLEKRVKKLALTQNVSFVGEVEQEDLPGYYTLGDVFSLPVRTVAGGLSVEGLGIVFLESQACGVPTVAGDGGGAPETIIPGITGEVIKGESGTVAQSISDLLSDPQRRANYSSQGRAVVSQEWNWNILGNRFRSVLQGNYSNKNQHMPGHERKEK